VSTPAHDEMLAAAEALMTTLSLSEAEAIAVQQANIVTSVLDILADVAVGAQEPVHGLYSQGRQDGEVALVRRLYEAIRRGRGL
jgi:hypothetical protein